MQMKLQQNGWLPLKNFINKTLKNNLNIDTIQLKLTQKVQGKLKSSNNFLRLIVLIFKNKWQIYQKNMFLQTLDRLNNFLKKV